MPRKPRIIVAGHPHHVIIRGVNREPIFYREFDYRKYLEILLSVSQANDCSIHAYVLMTNHVHLLITPTRSISIGKAIQSLGCRYVYYFNSGYRRTGTLWEGRYKSLLVESETYLLACQRYIEMNPVRAGMVSQPGRYPWSSYRHNAIGEFNPLITKHALYQELASDASARQSAYRSLFDAPYDAAEISQIRNLTNREWVLGSDRFKKQIQKKLNRRIEPLPRGGDRKSRAYRDSIPKDQ